MEALARVRTRVQHHGAGAVRRERADLWGAKVQRRHAHERDVREVRVQRAVLLEQRLVALHRNLLMETTVYKAQVDLHCAHAKSNENPYMYSVTLSSAN